MEERACQACGQQLPPQTRGRPRKYCTDPDCISSRQVDNRRYDACSSCGKSIKGGTGSKPRGQRTCLECRRAGRGPAWTKYDHTCQHCGTQFEAKQPDRKYCSQRCSMLGYLASQPQPPEEILQLRRLIRKYPQETEAMLSQLQRTRRQRDKERLTTKDRAGVVGAQWEKARAKVKARREPCWICGGAIDWDAPARTSLSFSVDHRIPRSKGGSHYDLNNLATAHYGCNSSRGNGTGRPRKAARRAATTTSDRW